MSKNEIIVRFASITDMADKCNSKNKSKRFIPMAENRNGKLFEFGMYDGERKKYVLSNIYATDAAERLAEIERMLEKAS